MSEMTLVKAIHEAYVEELRLDERVFIVGQDVRGGIFAHTNRLVQEFGEHRIVDTPISETAMFGTAFGAALAGYRPVVDFMFGAFTYVAGSEILVTLGQQYFLHGGQTPVPLVVTAGVGGSRLANDHAMVPRADFLHHPGVKYVFPSTPADAKGLMKAAIRDDNPVVFFWNLTQMQDRGEVPDGDDFVIPLGLAEVKRVGTDVTVLANGAGYREALAVAERLAGEISVEIVDPRSFEPFDLDTLLRSLEKTGHLVVVDDDYRNCGFSAEVVARVVEHGFDLLDAPVRRVAVEDFPIPGGVLEPLALPTADKIEAAVRDVVA